MKTYWIPTLADGSDCSWSFYADDESDAIKQAQAMWPDKRFTGARPEKAYTQPIRDLTPAEVSHFTDKFPDLEVPDCAIESEYMEWYGIRDASSKCNFWKRATREWQREHGCRENGARYVHGGEGDFFIEVSPMTRYPAVEGVAPWYPAEE